MTVGVVCIFVPAIGIKRKVIALRAVSPAHILVGIGIAQQWHYRAQVVKAAFAVRGASKNSRQLIGVRVGLSVQRIVKNNLLPGMQQGNAIG